MKIGELVNVESIPDFYGILVDIIKRENFDGGVENYGRIKIINEKTFLNRNQQCIVVPLDNLIFSDCL